MLVRPLPHCGHNLQRASDFLEADNSVNNMKRLSIAQTVGTADISHETVAIAEREMLVKLNKKNHIGNK